MEYSSFKKICHIISRTKERGRAFACIPCLWDSWKHLVGHYGTPGSRSAEIFSWYLSPTLSQRKRNSKMSCDGSTVSPQYLQGIHSKTLHRYQIHQFNPWGACMVHTGGGGMCGLVVPRSLPDATGKNLWFKSANQNCLSVASGGPLRPSSHRLI